MLYRRTYLESRMSLADSGQRVTDINVRDPITALWVEFRCANGATDNIKNLMADCITGIEVIDGAKVLYSLDGYEALALASYQLGRMPDQLVSELGGVTQNLSVPILFGRYEGDTELAFDPTKFTNPQVRITWNLATIQAVGAAGFATAGLVVTIMAIVMEGAPAPRAMLMHKEHYTYTTVAGVEYVDLPTDYPYRGLLFRGDLTAYALYGVVNNLKLNCDAGKYIPVDMRMTDLIRYLSMSHSAFGYEHQFHVANGTTIYFITKYGEKVSFTCQDTNDEVFKYADGAKGEGALAVYKAGSADTNKVNVYAAVWGYTPFRCLYVPFGRQDMPGDWFPAPTFKNIRLEATGAVASGTGYVCLSQEYAY